MAFSNPYRRALASHDMSAVFVDTIEILHPALTGELYAKWHEDFTADDETGTARTFKASDWLLVGDKIDDTTDQRANLRVNPLDGMIYEKLRNMSYDERQQEMTITHRIYRADNKALMVNPPPVWYVLAVQCAVDAVDANLTSIPLRNRAIGIYYTPAQFPVLYYN